MRVWVLGSGSRGNAILLECGGERLLIDAGFSTIAMASRLAAVDVDPASISSVLVTHEHTDHARGVGTCARKWGWTVYATSGTLAATADLLQDTEVRTIASNGTLTLDRFEVRTVPIPHDAAEPVAVVVTSRATGARAGVVYDLGAVTATVRAAMMDLDVLILESNHDSAMLANGPYPASVRTRIASRLGHLSNDAAARLARECAHAALSELVLAHVSEVCNEPARAISATSAALTGTRFRGRIHAAPQDATMGPFVARLRRRAEPAQYSLGL